MSTLYVNNIQPVSGSSLTLISASLVTVDELTVAGLTGSLFGTASYADYSVTASYALNSTPPGGSDGQIQFNSSSAFGADSNLFWDNTNKRLGVGTSSPSGKVDVNGDIKISSGSFIFSNTGGSGAVTAGLLFNPSTPKVSVYTNSAERVIFGSSTVATIKGSGSTSATTSLLVQNSSGTELLKVADNGQVVFANQYYFDPSPAILSTQSNFTINPYNSYSVGIGATPNASARLSVDSTTKGFLPPRMTTAQKNAISSPAAGLQVHDLEASGSYFYDGAGWRNVIAGDDTNLVWDNTNKRLGVGQTTPTARVHIKGSGSTSATTSLLVQNSSGTAILTVKDGGVDKQVVMNSAVIGSFDISGAIIQVGTGVNMVFRSGNGVAFNSDYSSANASAQLDVSSTTKGFLPPRMTETQKNAIATPAVGLMIYQTDATEGLYVYKSTGWTFVA